MCAKKTQKNANTKNVQSVSFHTFIACLYLYSLDDFYAVQIYFNIG